MILNQATDIKLGTTQVKKVMQGTTQVWPVIKKYRLERSNGYSPSELHPFSFTMGTKTYHQGIGGAPWYYTYNLMSNTIGTTVSARSDNKSEYFNLPDDTLVLKLGTVVSDTAPLLNEKGEKLYITNDYKFTFTPTGREAKIYYIFYGDDTVHPTEINKWRSGGNAIVPFIGYESNGTYYGTKDFVNLIPIDIQNLDTLPAFLWHLIEEK